MSDANEGLEPTGDVNDSTSVEDQDRNDLEGREPESGSSSLEDLEAEQLREMVKKLRRENGKTRVQKNEVTAELEEFRKWKESQLTAAEKAEKRAAEAERELAEMKRAKLQREIADEFELDSDLAEFITGSDAKEMRAKAEKLAAKTVSKVAGASDFQPGSKGKPPVKPGTAKTGGAFLEELARNM